MRPFLLSCLIVVFTGLNLTNTTSAAEIAPDYLTESYSDIDSFSLNTADIFPSLYAVNSRGERVNIRLLSNQANLLLIIYRGENSLFDIRQLASFENMIAELKHYNTRLVIVSPDDLASTKNTQFKFGSDYLFLSDPDMKLIDELGLRKDDTQTHRASILIAKGGSVLWFYADPDFKTSPSGEQIGKILAHYFK